MTVLALVSAIPVTSSEGTWLPDVKVGFSPADESSGIVYERCLPGKEPNAYRSHRL